MRIPVISLRRHAGADGAGWSDDRGDQRVAGLLDRFAEDALSPDGAAMHRMHAAARAAFLESAAAGGDGRQAPAGLIDAPADRRPFGWTRHRVAAAICAVAILTLSTVGLTAAESGPGQPFYRLRLGLEAVNLPPAGSDSRVDADLARADARLTDIAAAAARSDWSAAADAASAYRDVVASMVLPADSAGRQSSIARLDAELARLEQLRSASRPPETAEIDLAIRTVAALIGVPVPTALPSGGETPAGPSATGSDGSEKSPDRDVDASGSGAPERSDREDAHYTHQPDGSPGAGESGGRGPGPGDSHKPAESGGPGESGGGDATPGPGDGGSSQPSASPSDHGGSFGPFPGQSSGGR